MINGWDLAQFLSIRGGFFDRTDHGEDSFELKKYLERQNSTVQTLNFCAFAFYGRKKQYTQAFFYSYLQL